MLKSQEIVEINRETVSCQLSLMVDGQILSGDSLHTNYDGHTIEKHPHLMT